MVLTNVQCLVFLLVVPSAISSGPCDCFDTWDYFDVSYYGCDTTSDWNASWCYVEGGTGCDAALDSLIPNETRKWVECNGTDEDNTDVDDVSTTENDANTNDANTTYSTTTTAGATVSGSLQLTTTSQGKDKMCKVAKLARFADTWNVLVTALENSGLSMTGVYVGPLTCSGTTLLRGRRIEDDVSFDLEFDAMFSDTSSANSFSSEVNDAAESFQSQFESLSASTFNVTVSATLGELTVTSADVADSSGTTESGSFLGAFTLFAAAVFFN